MPDIKSKKSGTVWKDPQSFYEAQVAAKPHLKQYSPDDLWAAAQSDQNYEVAAQPVAPAVTSPPPAAAPHKFKTTTMLYNIPGSFIDNAKEMGRGIGSVLKAPRLTMDETGQGVVKPPDNLLSNAMASESPVSHVAGAAKEFVGKVADDYKDFYGSGRFLQNLESNPIRPIADAASFIPIIGWAAKAASLSGTAAKIGKVAKYADMVSSPVPAISHAGPAIQAGANKLARSSMKWALQLPPKTKPAMRTALSEFALRNEIPMTAKGASKADNMFGKAYGNMLDLESDATGRGVLIEPTPINTSIKKDMFGKSLDTTTDTKYETVVDELMSDPKNFGLQGAPGQMFPITPTRAGDIRKRFNKAVSPNRDAWESKPDIAEDPVKATAASKMNRYMKDQLAAKIPGHRKEATTAMLSKMAKDQSDMIGGRTDASSVVTGMQPGSAGNAGVQALKGNVGSGLVWGAIAKLTHTPQIVSRVAIGAFNPNINQMHRTGLALRGTGPRNMFNAAKQFGKPDPSRPFDEGDTEAMNPARPFKED